MSDILEQVERSRALRDVPLVQELIAEVKKYRDYYHQEQITANLHYQNLVVYKEKAESLEKEVERLRSELTTANVGLMAAGKKTDKLDKLLCASNDICIGCGAKLMRIKELEAELRKTMAARDEWIAIANQERLVRDRLEAQVDQSRTERPARHWRKSGAVSNE